MALLVPTIARALPAPSVDTEPAASGFVYVGTLNPTGLTLDRFPQIDLGTVTITRRDALDGSAKHVDVHGGTSQVEHFGIGLAQSFAGIAQASGGLDATVGEIRFSAASLATTLPFSYGDPFPGAVANNPFYAEANVGFSASFVDVVTIPATRAAPNPGDHDTVSLGVFVDCQAHNTAGPVAIRSHVGASLDSAGGQTLGEVAVDNPPQFSPTSDTSCPFGGANPTVSVPVETPLALHFSISSGVGIVAGHSLPPGDEPGGDAAIDALHTAVATITNSDGVGAVGSQNRDYGYAAYLATRGSSTTTTTSSTTSTSYVPPSTLPGCAGYCGDGIVQANCAEACECPMAADMQIITICDATTAIPALAPACARCTGCQVDLSQCAGATTTTTLGSAFATTTTIPPGCAWRRPSSRSNAESVPSTPS